VNGHRDAVYRRWDYVAFDVAPQHRRVMLVQPDRAVYVQARRGLAQIPRPKFFPALPSSRADQDNVARFHSDAGFLGPPVKICRKDPFREIEVGLAFETRNVEQIPA